MKRISFFLLVMLSVFLSTLCNASALTLTFEGVVAGQNMNFSVSGDVGGVNNTVGGGLPGQTLWSQDWTINAISDWALLPSPVPSSYINNGLSFGQMLYGTPYSGTNWGFRYHEDLGGNNSSSLEIWGHGVNIDTMTNFNMIEDLIGVNGAFNYSEVSAYATNYTSDGSTEANWTRNSAEGNLTLVAASYAYTPGSNVIPDQSSGVIPEPTSLFLFGLGGLLLRHRRKR